jgi:peptidyl-dipeptidase A
VKHTTLGRGVALAGLFAGVLACAPPQGTEQPTAPTAEAFLDNVNAQLKDLGKQQGAAGWVRSTYITEDTGVLAARASEDYLKFHSEAVAGSRAYSGQDLDPRTARDLMQLKLGTSMPAPDDAAKRKQLAETAVRLGGLYGASKYCDASGKCQGLDTLEPILADPTSDYDELLEAWTGWRTISPPMREDYQQFVALANEGAREIGFADLGEMWRSGYDMPADEFRAEAARLWGQVSPLYEQLHCYVRDQLADKYGEDKVSRDGPIPAHLLGNMWAQQWGEIYDLVAPYPGVGDLNVTAALQEQNYTAEQMTRNAESFFTSLGLPELPETFWERSMLVKPRDREVQCHASAWNVLGGDDVRIKMCIEPIQEHLTTIYHELGHLYYYLAYENQPPLYQSGAHDGFHEAIGDAITLSMTPQYLQSIGLVSNLEDSDKATINTQMKMALDKIAFLPFGKLIDEWRWDVFAGTISPANYNAGWWELREKYQGIEAPVARTEEDFDPGAKYHIPNNTPYTRYFLSFILQFQFQKALCDAAGFEGPLHECSVFGSKEAGAPFWTMLQAGSSEPWPDTLEKLTGARNMDAAAITEYFAPLLDWLEARNEGQTCGW